MVYRKPKTFMKKTKQVEIATPPTNKTEILNSKELKSILKGLEFLETNETEDFIVEDYYETNRGFDEIVVCIREIPFETTAGLEYQEYEIGVGVSIGEFTKLRVNSPLEFMERKELCKLIKQNVEFVDSRMGLGFFEN